SYVSRSRRSRPAKAGRELLAARRPSGASACRCRTGLRSPDPLHLVRNLQFDGRLNGPNVNRARFKGMEASSNWPRNRLLLALPSRDLKRVMPELEQIRCQRGQILMD